MDKPPYFPFYVGDFLSSRAVAQLTLEQLGAYTLLLCWQWDDPTCSLPADPGILGYLSRLGDRWVSVGQDIVSLCFERRGTRIFNLRLRQERKKYDAKCNAGREGGISSGRSRRKGSEAKPKQEASKTERTSKQKRTSQSQSQIQNQITTTATTDPPPTAAAPPDEESVPGEVPPEESVARAKARVLEEHGVALVAPLPWNREAAELWWHEYKGRPTKAFFHALKPAVLEYTWERVRPALVTYMAETPAMYVNIADKFVSCFGTWEARARGTRAPPPPSSRATARQDMAMAMIQGGMRETGSLGQGNGAPGGEPEGAGVDAGNGHPARGHLPAKAGASER